MSNFFATFRPLLIAFLWFNFNVLSYLYFSILDLQVGAVLPVSLTLTRQVLDERQTLMLLLDGLQKRISDGFEALTCLENTTQ